MKKRMNECSWLCCSHLCYKNYHPKTGCTQSSACFSPLLPAEPVKHRNSLFSSTLLTSGHQHLWIITKDIKSFICGSEKKCLIFCKFILNKTVNHTWKPWFCILLQVRSSSMWFSLRSGPELGSVLFFAIAVLWWNKVTEDKNMILKKMEKNSG